jgi:hypothetical protein
LGQYASQGGLPDAGGGRSRQTGRLVGDLVPVVSYEHFTPRFQKQLDPFQASTMRQAPAPAASNTRVGGENPVRAMLSRLMLMTARGVPLNAL